MNNYIETLQCDNPAGHHTIAYNIWRGAPHAPPTVCAHGLSRNGRDFDALAAVLCKDRRVYCPDTVGRGASDWLARREHYNYGQYLADATILIEHIRETAATADPSLDWVGTSMGGIVGMMLAAQAQTPIRRLVLNDIGARIGAAALNRIGEYVGVAPGFDTLAEYQRYLACVHASFGPLTDAQWAHLAKHSYRVEDGLYRPHYDPNIAAAFDAPVIDDVEMWDLWQAIETPTLVIRGAQSDLLSAETLTRMCEMRPETEVLEVADAGHAPALMRDFEIDAIQRFLSA